MNKIELPKQLHVLVLHDEERVRIFNFMEELTAYLHARLLDPVLDTYDIITYNRKED